MTGTELLIEVMEEFGKSEPVSVFVVYTNQDGNVGMHSNCGKIQIMGLAEYAKQNCINLMFAEENKR